METPRPDHLEVLEEYVKEEKERREASNREFWRNSKAWDEEYANFKKAVALLSRQTGVDEKTLHTQIRKAMGIAVHPEPSFPTKGHYQSFAVATALIHGYHPVVKLLERLRHGSEVEDDKVDM